MPIYLLPTSGTSVKNLKKTFYNKCLNETEPIYDDDNGTGTVDYNETDGTYRDSDYGHYYD